MPTFYCDECQFEKQVEDRFAGQTVKCPRCKAKSVVIGDATASSMTTQPPQASGPPKPQVASSVPRSPASGNRSSLTNALLGGILAVLLLTNLPPLLKSQQWEYWIASPADLELRARMRELGEEGWELVTARRATSRYSDDASYEMIFKRPRRD